MRLPRLSILSWLVFWAVMPIEADARSEKGKGRPMTQRILFHPAPTSEWVKGLKVETLGRIPRGAWLSVDDATALELLKRDKSTLMLYPTREEYQEAMEGLSEAETAEAVGLHHSIIAADPKSYSMPYFSERGLSILSAIASGSNEPGTAGTDSRSAFNRQLNLLRVIGGGDDDGGFGAISLFSSVFDPINELNWEVESLHKHVGDALPPVEPDLEKSRRELALQLQLGEKKQGVKYDHEPDGRVFVRLERGIYATPIDAMLVRGIRDGHEPVLEWKDGFVCAWSEFQFDEYPMKSKKKQILYFNANYFRTDHMSLTKSQLRVRFSKRGKLPLEDDAREHLANLKLGVVLNLGKKSKAAVKFDAPLADRMSRHAEMEAESLRKLLAAYPIWRKKKAYVPEEIRSESTAAIIEVEFWNAWAARNQWYLIQPQVEKVLSAMRNQ